ncbi:MAG: cytochrome ubiquinol oxidase subunit I, partial [Pseudomonadota bacterium]|nr:cytochrome ubiquinol oxidase subunit I [Pseudomonadota bacterium]
WIVQGIMRTADATSPVPAGTIGVTLALFVLVYGVVFSLGIFYINRLIAKGPQHDWIESQKDLAASPMAAAKDAGRAAMQKG